MEDVRVRIEIDKHGVADVCLARGDKMNALDSAMFDALADAVRRLKVERGLRAVVLHGEGKAFCAGLDMAQMARLHAGGPGALRDLRPRTHGLANSAQIVGLGWREVPVPVMAAVHGVAFGGGLQVALGADLRLVSADAQMSVMEIKWGLVPDMAGVALMRGLVRDDHARELAYTGRIVPADEAVALGLGTRVCDDPLAEARAMARAISLRSPSAIRAAKRLLNLAVAADAASGLMAESVEQQKLIGSPNQLEAVMSNLQKRAANYKD